jgi:hypothetical protein
MENIPWDILTIFLVTMCSDYIKITFKHMRFVILMTVTMEITVFWDVMHLPDYMVSPQKTILFIVSAMRSTIPTFKHGYKSPVLRTGMLLTRDLLH